MSGVRTKKLRCSTTLRVVIVAVRNVARVSSAVREQFRATSVHEPVSSAVYFRFCFRPSLGTVFPGFIRSRFQGNDRPGRRFLSFKIVRYETPGMINYRFVERINVTRFINVLTLPPPFYEN